tara:strand:- start:4421 stop:5476 length:1056 start_codon:yes stop_codon:yes gene_type:complete
VNILFLYTELAGYSSNCLNHYAKNNNQNKLHVIRWPINKEAPFKFKFENNIKVYLKNEVNIDSYIKTNKIKIIICCGWIDKEYISVIKTNRAITTILMFDNYWKNTMRQNIGKIIFPFKIKPLFDLCWIPGEVQKKYAKKLGFKEDEIFLGFYATDLKKQNEAFYKSYKKKEKDFPKTFLYVGRYLKLKGVQDLWRAFYIFNKKNKNWKLHCVGEGELFNVKPKHENIIHHGFIQPKLIHELVDQSGIFIMPSHYDHWGMALQEFTAAGLPIICSDKVGSNYEFLKDGENGYLFKAKNVNSLVDKMEKIASLTNEELLKFSKKSLELSLKYDTSTWSNTLNKIINKLNIKI